MRYQQIGDILIFNKISKQQAMSFFKKFPRIKTICVRTGPIRGRFRKPQLKVLISRVKSKKTETIHKESGILYKLDVRKLMFAKGNINERHRLAKLAKPAETVLDMFAGIGYFSLSLAKKVKQVYAIELNPTAYRYLLENIKLNRLYNTKAVYGNCAKVISRLARQGIEANRIIMGYLPDAFSFLNAAFRVARQGTVIHYSCLISRREKDKGIRDIINKIGMVASQYGFRIKLLKAVRVKGFSPALEHYVLNIALRRRRRRE